MAFFWKNQGGSRHDGEGFTRDISEGGMFVFADNPPPVGTIVRMDVFFPPFESGSALQVKAKCEVLRVESSAPGEGRGGFAALSKSFVLRNNPAGGPGRTGGANERS